MAGNILKLIGRDGERPRSPGVRVVLPDFRRLGVMLRIIVMAEGVRLMAAYLRAGSLLDTIEAVINQGMAFEPALLTMLILLFALNPYLSQLNYRAGCAAVLAATVLTGIGWRYGYSLMFPEAAVPSVSQVAFMSLILSGATLFYFNWRYRVLSPALSEARLMALQARIRPHFLFNSLNTVLGLMRTEPERAESVLENLAELFRALMGEPSILVPLAKELDLARSYAEIEAVRLEGRLTVNWQCQSAPMDALVPRLILQPLLENAVYHGIEPAPGGGVVNVTIFAKGDQLNLVVRNPCHPKQERRSGNRLALDNIRERLDLHFDAEANMRTYEAGGEFVVQIRMPYKHD